MVSRCAWRFGWRVAGRVGLLRLAVVGVCSLVVCSGGGFVAVWRWAGASRDGGGGCSVPPGCAVVAGGVVVWCWWLLVLRVVVGWLRSVVGGWLRAGPLFGRSCLPGSAPSAPTGGHNDFAGGAKVVGGGGGWESKKREAPPCSVLAVCPPTAESPQWGVLFLLAIPLTIFCSPRGRHGGGLAALLLATPSPPLCRLLLPLGG